MKITAHIFAKNKEISDMMKCLDLDDRGMKIFGFFGELEIETEAEINEEYIVKTVQFLINFPDFYYVSLLGYFSFKDKEHVKMLSTGTKFNFVSDMIKELEAKNYKEIEYDSNFIEKQKATV